MDKIMNIWNMLSGKKTVISAVLKALADVMTVAGHPEAAFVVDQVGNVLLSVGLAHKGIKIAK